MFELLKTYRKYDPSTSSTLEILLFYPGVKALFFHRIAQFLLKIKVPLLPRGISELSRFITGIEIHPGAMIGKNLIIDHGMGVVIGETAVIEDNVIIFHGVTLGGTRFDRNTKRHPTLGSHVVVGAGAKIMGNIRVGDHSRVGANSVVVDDVPPHCTVVGIPGRILKHGIAPGCELDHDDIKS